MKRFLLKKIEMVIVGPEDPLVLGIYDYFQADHEINHISVIGPSKEGAQLEGSKDLAKDFMLKNNIPTAKHQSFSKENINEGLIFILLFIYCRAYTTFLSTSTPFLNIDGYNDSRCCYL